MAKFRRGHQGGRRMGFRAVILFLVLCLLVAMMAFLLRMLNAEGGNLVDHRPPEDPEAYLPAQGDGEIVHHTYYSLSYLEEYEQAQWVAYELTRFEISGPKVPRTDWFYPDPSVTTSSALHRDYTGSGYTRGHLAPAADMAFDTVAMRESFMMSNISPQVRAFNNGIWRELEEQVRDWVRSEGRLFVVSGPVFGKKMSKRIGGNRVAVPDAFYKVLVDPDVPGIKAIAFVIPNARSDKPLMDYAVSIDSVEHLTGIDFFPGLPVRIDEATCNTREWEMEEWRFWKRVKVWNDQ